MSTISKKKYLNKKTRKNFRIDELTTGFLMDAKLFARDFILGYKNSYKDFTNWKKKAIKQLKTYNWGSYPDYYDILEEELEKFINNCMDRVFSRESERKKQILEKLKKN